MRFDEGMLRMIDQYAALHDMNRSDAIRELLRNGLSNRANLDLQDKWTEMMNSRWLTMQEQTTKLIKEGKSLIFVRDNFMCQKCRSTSHLQVYSIDRDPLNTNPINLITLCKDCASRATKFTPKRRVVEDFLEWFYLL
jgi:5-methylcytosine-specific restriction endonuclease McrA